MANTPRLIQYSETTAWNTGSASKTSAATISWLAGDLLVFIAGSAGNDAITTPTGTGLTFVVQKSNVTASTCGTKLCTVSPVAAGSSIITATNPSATNHWGFGVWLFRGTNGVGASAEQHTATKTVTLTPLEGTNSAIVWASFDFAAGTIPAATPTPTDTRQAFIDTGAYNVMVADLLPQASSGAVSYGQTGGGTGPFSIVVQEIRGFGSLPNNYQFGRTGDGMSVSEKIR